MYINKYLVITPSAQKYSGKAGVKLIDKLGRGSIPSNAVVLKLNLELPDALFQKPQLEATIKVNSDQVSKPVITPDVIENIREVLQKNMGIDLTIAVVENKEKKK